MSHIFGYICSDRSVTHQLFKDLQPHLELHDPASSSGVGMGWMQEDRSLLRNHPKPSAGLADLLSLASDLPSRTIVGHVRGPNVGAVSAADLAPFRFRRWLWVSADASVVSGEPLPLPDHIRQNLHGHSTSEWLFHAVLAELSEADVLDSFEVLSKPVVAAVQRGIEKAREAGIKSLEPAILATNKWMLGLNAEHALFYRVIKGYEIFDEPAFAGHKPRGKQYPSFRAALLTNGLVSGEGWHPVQANHAVWFDSQCNPEFISLSL